MDDGGLRRTMVNPPDTAPARPGTADVPQDKSLFWRSTIYTVIFLVFILGLVPWVAHRTYEYLYQSITTNVGEKLTLIRQWVGGAVFIVGLVAYLICSCWLMFFGKGPHVEFDPPKEFVATGPYRWCRNPVVITLFVAAIGEAIYFSSMGILLFVLLIGVPFAHVQVTRIEEPRLRKRFGDTYGEYCNRVPRWWPRRPAA